MRQMRCSFSYQAAGETVRFAPSDGFAINWPDGADAITMTFTEGRNPDGVGSSSWETLVPARPLTINGYIIARPAKDKAKLLQKIFAAGIVGRLIAEDADGVKWWLDCKVVSTPQIEPRRTLPRFQVQLRADYPYWQETRGYGVPLDALNQTSYVRILGDEPALYRLIVTIDSGNADGIGIRDEETGEALEYHGSVAAGQTLTLLVQQDGRVKCTIGGASAINGVTGVLRKLQPGMRRLTVAAGAGVTGSVDVQYWEARSGV